jgi:hypothetical protein
MYGDPSAGVPGHVDEYPFENPAWCAAPIAPDKFMFVFLFLFVEDGIVIV